MIGCEIQSSQPATSGPCVPPGTGWPRFPETTGEAVCPRAGCHDFARRARTRRVLRPRPRPGPAAIRCTAAELPPELRRLEDRRAP